MGKRLIVLQHFMSDLAGSSVSVRSRSGKDQRARVTNGALFAVSDNGITNGAWARRLRDLIQLHSDDLGGAEHLSEAVKSLVRRAATLEVELEGMELRFASEGAATPTGLDLYQRTAGNLRRLLESLGLDRRPRDITPNIDLYLASKRGHGGDE